MWNRNSTQRSDPRPQPCYWTHQNGAAQIVQSSGGEDTAMGWEEVKRRMSDHLFAESDRLLEERLRRQPDPPYPPEAEAEGEEKSYEEACKEIWEEYKNKEN